MRFLIISTGYNCANYVHRNYLSVYNQSEEWKMIMVSDGSTDNTGDNINKYVDRRVISEVYNDNVGAAKRRYDAIHKYADPEDIVCLLGMDDELLPGALTRVKMEYEKGMLTTYGNWIRSDGYKLPRGFIHFDKETHNDRSYRKVQYRSTALNTFRAFLFLSIPEYDFKYNGEWVKQTTESEVMFSCMEMAGGDRIGVIDEPIYLYNERFKQNAKKRLGAEKQLEIYNHIISKKPKNLWP